MAFLNTLVPTSSRGLVRTTYRTYVHTYIRITPSLKTQHQPTYLVPIRVYFILNEKCTILSPLQPKLNFVGLKLQRNTSQTYSEEKINVSRRNFFLFLNTVLLLMSFITASEDIQFLLFFLSPNWKISDNEVRNFLFPSGNSSMDMGAK